MSLCHLCKGTRLTQLVDFGEHPIAHRFLADRAAKEYVHRVSLKYCEDCGLTQLVDPIPPELLYTEYAWLSAWKPQPHMARLIEFIGNFPGVDRNSRILEVGCNDGSFLAALREAGYRNTVGIEPARDACAAAKEKGLNVVHGYFGADAARAIASANGQFDVFVSRQVLEHVTELADFRQGMRTALRPGGYALIEVPNFDFSLRTRDYSAIWEEHVNHFTRDTLDSFFANGGFRQLDSETAPFCGEALIMTAQMADAPAQRPASTASAREQVMAFGSTWPRYRTQLNDYLSRLRSEGRRIAVYGAGCRACCVINYSGIAQYVDAVLDDQPEKQGKFMPGSRLPIVPGEMLERSDYGLCLLAVNAENESKVMAKHAAYERAGGRFLSLLPPSDRLVPL